MPSEKIACCYCCSKMHCRPSDCCIRVNSWKRCCTIANVLVALTVHSSMVPMHFGGFDRPGVSLTVPTMAWIRFQFACFVASCLDLFHWDSLALSSTCSGHLRSRWEMNTVAKRPKTRKNPSLSSFDLYSVAAFAVAFGEEVSLRCENVLVVSRAVWARQNLESSVVRWKKKLSVYRQVSVPATVAMCWAHATVRDSQSNVSQLVLEWKKLT